MHCSSTASPHYMRQPKNGDADMIKLLLEHKADINATTASSETAMDVALKCNHTDAVHLFVGG